VRRSAFVLVLVLVLERCCLQERRVNPIRSAFPELHPRSWLNVLVRRFVLVLVRESATRSIGVLEYCANWELHPASAGLGVLFGDRAPLLGANSNQGLPEKIHVERCYDDT
jgi:hypothetical protein